VTGSTLGSGSAATAAREIWQEPVRGAAVYPGLAALSGVEQLQTFLTIPMDGRELVATGTLLHRGKRLAIGTAEVMHGADRVALRPAPPP
jgi:hypothetical protein